MAGIAKAETRSVRDQFDDLIRSAGSGGFSTPNPRLDFSKTPGRGGAVTKIGDRWYKAVDHGGATVVVPATDPRSTPADLAEQQQAIRQASFDATHPMAGAFSGLAALFNASPRTRDVARTAGAMTDTALSLGMARTPSPPRATRSGQIAPPMQVRPSIRLGELSGKGQATGVSATITAPMLGTGTKANPKLKPPGWSGHGTNHNEARGHLLAKVLGGSGSDMRNLVTQTHAPMNSSWMRDFEVEVARRVRDGEVFEYLSKPLYGAGYGAGLPPSAILLMAHGSRGRTSAKVIGNPAGRRK